MARVSSGATGVQQTVSQAFWPPSTRFYGISFLASHGVAAFFVMGAIFLAVTGAERFTPIRPFRPCTDPCGMVRAGFPGADPELSGVGVLVLHGPTALVNPFFHLVPGWALPGLVALAALATVIASQAVITGACSMTRAAIQLGLLPPVDHPHLVIP